MTTPAPERRSVSWTVYALIIAVPAVAAILIWQLQKLEPSKWCGAAIGTAKITDTNLDVPKACFSLLSTMLGIYKQNTLALIAVLGLSIVILVVSTLRMRVAINAPGGFGGAIGDDAMALPQTPAAGAAAAAGAATEVAERIEEQTKP